MINALKTAATLAAWLAAIVAVDQIALHAPADTVWLRLLMVVASVGVVGVACGATLVLWGDAR